MLFQNESKGILFLRGIHEDLQDLPAVAVHVLFQILMVIQDDNNVMVKFAQAVIKSIQIVPKVIRKTHY